MSIAGSKAWKFFFGSIRGGFFSEFRLMDATVLGWGFPTQERARALFRTMNEFSQCLCCLFHL